MSEKVDLSEFRGNWLLERHAFEEITAKDGRRAWPALAESFGWKPWDEPRWMTKGDRREFWREINRRTGGTVGRFLSRLFRRR